MADSIHQNTEVVLYTDGACSGNPGPGGWALFYVISKQVKPWKKAALRNIQPIIRWN